MSHPALAIGLNALKFLSNPMVLLSVALAVSMTFGGCQKRRVAGLKADVAKVTEARDELKKKAKEAEGLLTAARADLAAAKRDLQTRATENTALRTELASCQDVRIAIEAEKQRAIAAAERKRLDTERTLASVTERFAAYVRKPQCRAAMDLPLCD